MKPMQYVLRCMLAITIAGCTVRTPELPPDGTSLKTVQSKIFQDTLGIQHAKFPIKRFVQLLPFGSGIGNLDTTFGASLDHVVRALSSGKVNYLRTHFYNGPGLRNRQAQPNEPTYGYSVSSFSSAWERNEAKQVAWLRSRAQIYCQLHQEYPDVIFEWSPTLEHNLSKKAWLNQAKVLEEACPGLTLINSPGAGVQIGVPYPIERHGANWSPTAPCRMSYDGQWAVDADVNRHKTKFAVCDRFGIWVGHYNLRLGEFSPPLLRDDAPDTRQLQDLIVYEDPMPAAPIGKPAQCRKVNAIKDPTIWKPWAEDKGTNDPRANLPVFIRNYKDLRGIVMLASNGKKIATLPYYGNFGNTQWRYYSGSGPNLSGSQIAARAKELSGFEQIYLQIGPNCDGPFHPAYRQGITR